MDDDSDDADATDDEVAASVTGSACISLTSTDLQHTIDRSTNKHREMY